MEVTVEADTTVHELEEAAVAPPQQEHARGTIGEWTVTVLLLLFGTTFLIQAFLIPTASMEDTLLIGDHLLVDKLAYAQPGPFSKFVLPYRPVKRGDIIVFRYPADLRQTYVKRVIGVPGDRIRVADKQLYLNGRLMHEPYKVHKSDYTDSYRDNFPSEPNTRLEDGALTMLEKNVVNGEVVVPPGSYFAMGDNRDQSSDSRYWGFVPRDNIIGKPLVIYWSYETSTERLSSPGITIDHVVDLFRNFFRKTRWERTLKIIRGYPLE
jgi:signal peptidase I